MEDYPWSVARVLKEDGGGPLLASQWDLMEGGAKTRVVFDCSVFWSFLGGPQEAVARRLLFFGLFSLSVFLSSPLRGCCEASFLFLLFA